MLVVSTLEFSQLSTVPTLVSLPNRLKSDVLKVFTHPTSDGFQSFVAPRTFKIIISFFFIHFFNIIRTKMNVTRFICILKP